MSKTNTDLTNPHGSILVPKTSKNSKETKKTFYQMTIIMMIALFSNEGWCYLKAS